MQIDPINIAYNKRHYYLIGISIEGDSAHYNLMTVCFLNDELIIKSRYESSTFDADFEKKLEKDYPVILHIDGQEIISKIIENQVGYKKNLLFNTNLEDFYFYEYFQADNTIGISIVRKAFIHFYVKKFNNLGRTVIEVSFGPFVLSNLLLLMPEVKKTASSRYSISIEGGVFKKLTKGETDHVYNVNNEDFNSKEMPLLASFFGYKYPKEEILFENEFIKANREEFKYKKWFKLFVAGSVFVLLTAVLISHFALSAYLVELGEKQSLHVFSSQKINELNLLKEEQKLKESIIRSSDIFNKNFITKYIADIGNSTPNTIKLSRVDFLPTLKKIKINEKINFTEKTIIVEGQTNNDAVFNEWTLKLQGMDWVKKIDITKYAQTDKSVNMFQLNIKI